jgi:hypothetical protein
LLSTSADSTEPNEKEEWKVEALIRANFGIDPDTLQASQWCKLYAQAMWLEHWRMQNQAEMFKELLGG